MRAVAHVADCEGCYWGGGGLGGARNDPSSPRPPRVQFVWVVHPACHSPAGDAAPPSAADSMASSASVAACSAPPVLANTSATSPGSHAPSNTACRLASCASGDAAAVAAVGESGATPGRSMKNFSFSRFFFCPAALVGLRAARLWLWVCARVLQKTTASAGRVVRVPWPSCRDAVKLACSSARWHSASPATPAAGRCSGPIRLLALQQRLESCHVAGLRQIIRDVPARLVALPAGHRTLHACVAVWCGAVWRGCVVCGCALILAGLWRGTAPENVLQQCQGCLVQRDAPPVRNRTLLV
jgi:hypothetical protein